MAMKASSPVRRSPTKRLLSRMSSVVRSDSTRLGNSPSSSRRGSALNDKSGGDSGLEGSGLTCLGLDRIVLTEDKGLLYDVPESALELRNGEEVAVSFSCIPDSKNYVGPHGDVGTLDLTPLRAIWKFEGGLEKNYSIGWKQVDDLSISEPPLSEIRFLLVGSAPAGSHMKSPKKRSAIEQNTLSFKINNADEKDYSEKIKTAMTVFQGYRTSVLLRELKTAMSFVYIMDRKLILCPQEEIVDTLNGVLRLGGEHGVIGTLFVTNVRLVFNSDVDVVPNPNISVPYIHFENLRTVYLNKYGGRALLVDAHQSAPISFMIHPESRCQDVCKRIRTEAIQCIRKPQFGIDAGQRGGSSNNPDLPSAGELPATILPIIFSFLDVRQLYLVSSVCHSWHEAAESKAVWGAICRRRYPIAFAHAGTSYVRRLLRSEKWKDVYRILPSRRRIMNELVGRYFCAAVRDNGYLYAWGVHPKFHLPTSGCVPSRVHGCRVSSVSVGQEHLVAVSDSGSLLTWGRGKFGALGHGDSKDVLNPRKVGFFKDKRVVDASAGDGETCCVTEDGNVYHWGWNVVTPKKVSENSIRYVAVSMGREHCLVLSQDGRLHSFGDGSHGKLGLGSSILQVKTPTQIDPLAKYEVVSFSAGSDFSACVNVRGHAFTWGRGWNYQTGHPSSADVFIPTRIEVLTGKCMIAVSAGHGGTALVTDEGEVYLLGRQPGIRRWLKGKNIVAVSHGYEHSDGDQAPIIAVSASGDLYSWGDGIWGQLGAGESVGLDGPELVPQRIPELQNKAIVSEVYM